MVIPVSLAEHAYDIVIEKGALKKAGKLLSVKGRALVVTDSGVPGIYAETLMSQLENPALFVFPQGEENKNTKTLLSICEKLLEENFTRSDCVIALGGGVVGDMAGLASAIYMRGIDFYNIPTTLLSQVDSSVGGKTAVDFFGAKNLLGAFHQPKKVIIDPELLSTLEKRQVSNGFAEAVKIAVTKSCLSFLKAEGLRKKLKRLSSVPSAQNAMLLKRTKRKARCGVFSTSVIPSVTQLKAAPDLTLCFTENVLRSVCSRCAAKKSVPA